MALSKCKLDNADLLEVCKSDVSSQYNLTSIKYDICDNSKHAAIQLRFDKNHEHAIDIMSLFYKSWLHFYQLRFKPKKIMNVTLNFLKSAIPVIQLGHPEQNTLQQYRKINDSEEHII